MTRHDAAKLNAPDLTAEIERLTAERDGLRSDLETANLLREEAEIELRHTRSAPDPEAPLIPCQEVEPTDGRRTWRAMGEDVRTLGDEWERSLPGVTWWRNSEFAHVEASTQSVYLIRRTTPPAFRTVRVKWWEAVGRRLPSGDAISNLEADTAGVYVFGLCGERVSCPWDGDGTVEVLTEDGDR